MVTRLLDDFESDLGSVTIVPSTGGVYEVTADDELIFSKKALGRHAEYDEVAEPIRQRIGGEGAQPRINLLDQG
jgi:selenoprotein W-related protein